MYIDLFLDKTFFSYHISCSLRLSYMSLNTVLYAYWTF